MTSAVATGAGRAAAGTAGSGSAAAGSSSGRAAAAQSAASTWASRPRRRGGRVDGPAQSVAGLIIGLMVWAWIGLPLLRGGPAETRRTIRAKFVNQDPEGRWLP